MITRHLILRLLAVTIQSFAAPIFAAEMTSQDIRARARAVAKSASFEIALFSENEKSAPLKCGSCRCPGDGISNHTGRYEFISIRGEKVVARSKLTGHFEFADNGRGEGISILGTAPNPELVVVTQYGACMYDHLHFFRISSTGSIHPVDIIDRNRSRSNSLSGDSPKIGGPEVSVGVFDPGSSSKLRYYKFDGKNLIYTREENVQAED